MIKLLYNLFFTLIEINYNLLILIQLTMILLIFNFLLICVLLKLLSVFFIKKSSQRFYLPNYNPNAKGKDKHFTVGFFHPFCNSGGGGERFIQF